VPGAANAAPAHEKSQWRDVKYASRGWFAKAAIDNVAGRNDWMRDYGPNEFHPTAPETRGLLAKAVVKAFAPTQDPERGVQIKDVAPGTRLYPFVSVAVANGWMDLQGGNFNPTKPVDEFTVAKALVEALGLDEQVRGANHVHTSNGTPLKHSPKFGVYLIGRVIGLWHNHDPEYKGDSERYDLLPTTPVPRADVAYALHAAAELGDDAQWYADQYIDFDIGTPSPAMRKVIEFGMQYVGYPYIYAGEWNTPGPAGYCCGEQLQGGFDCSGFTWWIMRAGDSVWNNQSIRGYHGWSVPQRSSSLMAGAIPKKARVKFQDLRPGDLMFYGDSQDPASVYHVDTYIGNGWALDSGGNGVTITNVADGWHRDTFVFGRRIIGS
jgi:hypothetical protein